MARTFEIIRPFDGSRIVAGLFDFDGTISRERDGWPNLMVATHIAAIQQAIPSFLTLAAMQWALSDIQSTIGQPTYVQMRKLSEFISAHGGVANSPSQYKEVYVSLLSEMVKSRHHQLLRGEISLDDLCIAGSRSFVGSLRPRLPKGLFLASGTDIVSVRESAELLDVRHYFNDIVAAGSLPNPESCPKAFVIQKLVREHDLRTGELVCFGDGVPEIHECVRAGGIAVGVLSPDYSFFTDYPFFTLEQKRQRLITAGAHILITDFTEKEVLLETIFSQKLKK